MALLYLEELKCPCGCGNYRDESMSREWDWDVQTVKCYAGQALDIQRRIYDEQNKNVKGAHDGLIWSATPVVPKKPRP